MSSREKKKELKILESIDRQLRDLRRGCSKIGADEGTEWDDFSDSNPSDPSSEQAGPSTGARDGPQFSPPKTAIWDEHRRVFGYRGKGKGRASYSRSVGKKTKKSRSSDVFSETGRAPWVHKFVCLANKGTTAAPRGGDKKKIENAWTGRGAHTFANVGHRIGSYRDPF